MVEKSTEKIIIKNLKLFFCLVFCCFLVCATGFNKKIVQAASDSPVYYPKVYVIVYNPVLKTKNNQTLIDYKNWNDPNVLLTQTIGSMQDLSYGMINYHVVDSVEIDDIPIKQDGYDYTEEEYLDCIEGSRICHNNPFYVDYVNYHNILEDHQLCEKANQNEIDEVWLFGGPWFGFYEANMAGVEAFHTNGPIITGTSCQRAIHIMGFSYERTAVYMLENFGHRFEGTLDYYLGDIVDSTGYSWKNYITNLGQNPSLPFFGCGTIHYPPNALFNYQYANQNYVQSNCDDWLQYPNMQGITQAVNCSQWGCTTDGYFRWWFQHLPHVEGGDTNGNYTNWWRYFTNASVSTPTSTPVLTPVHCTPVGDTNCNGVVDILDLAILLSKFGSNDSTNDLNYNGKVDIRDLSILLSNFGKS